MEETNTAALDAAAQMVKDGDFFSRDEDLFDNRPKDIDDIVWVKEAKGYVIKRPDGTYGTSSIYNQEGAYRHLTGRCSKPPKLAKAILAMGCFPHVDTIDINPDKPARYTDTTGQEVLNSYRPPTLSAKQGSWPRIFEVMHYLTGCESDAAKATEGMTWLFNWTANLIQNPGVRGMVGVIVSGPQGCGKTSYGEFIRLMLGPANTGKISGANLTDDFNSDYAQKLFLLADEVMKQTAADRYDISDKLKYLFTEGEVTLKIPHAPRINVPNRLTIYMTTNHAVSLKVEGEDERRTTVFAAPAGLCTQAYKDMVTDMFDPRTKEPTQDTLDELAAFKADLLAHQVDYKRARTPLRNEARANLVAAGRAAHESFFADLVDNGEAWLSRYLDAYRSRHQVIEPAEYEDGLTLDAVFHAYLQYCDEFRYTGHKSKDNFKGEWKARMADKWPSRKRTKAGPRPLLAYGLHYVPPEGVVKLHKDTLNPGSKADSI